jgi:hypothetical protein
MPRNHVHMQLSQIGKDDPGDGSGTTTFNQRASINIKDISSFGVSHEGLNYCVSWISGIEGFLPFGFLYSLICLR